MSFDPDPQPLRIAVVVSRPIRPVLEVHPVPARALAAAGHHVTVLTDPVDDGWPEEEDVNGVAVRRFLPHLAGRRRSLSPGMARHLARSAGRYDLVHVAGEMDAAAAAVARWWAGPLVLTLPLDGPDSLLPCAERPLCPAAAHALVARASAVVWVSADAPGMLAAWLPDGDEGSMVVPVGSDEDDPAPVDPAVAAAQLVAVYQQVVARPVPRPRSGARPIVQAVAGR